ncbi:hypothetical protein [Demequina silvatica]|uniref:hypothetical protein n=1 Tax=Demequina silvatica TaxID=1638988 RepID=UPI00078214AF|nr:hypothetical protein [Demequina silvatica]
MSDLFTGLAASGRMAAQPGHAPVDLDAPPPPRPGRDIPGWSVALIVVGGLVLQGGLGVASALVAVPFMQGVEQGIAAASSPAPDAVPLSEAVPAGWDQADSVSGRLAYSFDPTWEQWEDFASVDEGNVLTGQIESVASMVADGDIDYPATWVEIYASHDALASAGAEIEGHTFLDTWVTDADSMEVTAERAVTTAQGYTAYEIEADVTYDGWPTHDCLVTIDAGDSLVFVYGSADLTSLPCTDVTRTVAQGIVAR